jgi:hypothetical protein
MSHWLEVIIAKLPDGLLTFERILILVLVGGILIILYRVTMSLVQKGKQ